MSIIDWLVLASTLSLIVLYGVYKSRGLKSMDSYLLADREMPWYNVGLSVMATQASAITFLSAQDKVLQMAQDSYNFISVCLLQCWYYASPSFRYSTN